VEHPEQLEDRLCWAETCCRSPRRPRPRAVVDRDSWTRHSLADGICFAPGVFRAVPSVYQWKHQGYRCPPCSGFNLQRAADLFSQGRNKLNSRAPGAFVRHSFSIVRNGQPCFSVAYTAVSLTWIAPPSEPNAYLMLLVATSFRIRPTRTARSIASSSSSVSTSIRTSSVC
jgi:hypothetical protein